MIAAVAVAATVWAAMPHEAWLPFGAVTRPDSWHATLAAPGRALADLQTGLGTWAWPSKPLRGAIVVAAVVAAVVASVQAIALRAAGLGALLATMLALVAASGPLAAWQAASPLGAAPASLASVLLLWRLVRQRVRVHVTWFGSLAAVTAVALVVGVLVAAAALVGRWQGAPPASATLGLMHAELGVMGLVLLLPALGRRHSALVPRERVWLGAAALWLISTPMAPPVRAAILLPWAWWLVGAGMAQLLAWRPARAGHWAAVGLCAWIALHAARVPWEQQRLAAALTRSWADGLAARVDASYPLVGEHSASGRLAGAVIASRARASDTPPGDVLIPRRDARAATAAGRHPIVVSTAGRESLRWGGVALAAVPAPVGVPLERLVDALPRGTIVLAALSADAAAALSPLQWQALGQLGLRLVDAGTPRAHALAGVTGARVEALEMAQSGSVRLDVLPGDALGRIGTRSPVDARLEADAAMVRIHLRDRPFLEQHGLALLFFSTRGDFLGYRTGAGPAHLDGPPLGSGPLVSSMGAEALPCTEVAAGAPADVTPLTSGGALGITWQSAGALRLRLSRPDGTAGSAVRIAGDPQDTDLPALTQTVAQADRGVTLTPRSLAPTGLFLRGPIARAEIAADVPARVCAAWPMLHALDIRVARVDMPVLPRLDPHYGGGWHDMETLAGGGYFRWMAGREATLLVALRPRAPMRVVLDAQGVMPPRPGDRVRLSINDVDLGARPLHATRGLYEWEVPASEVRSGLNTLAIETTQAVRPADRAPGADPRLLGLAVYGWSLVPAAPAASENR